MEERHIDYRDRLMNRTYNAGPHPGANNFTPGQNNHSYNDGRPRQNLPGRITRDGNDDAYPHQNNGYNLPEQPARNGSGYNDVPLHNNNTHGQPANNNTFPPPFRDNGAGQHDLHGYRQNVDNNHFSGGNNNFNMRQQQNYGSDKSRTPPRPAPEMEQHYQQRSITDNHTQRSFGGEKRGARF